MRQLDLLDGSVSREFAGVDPADGAFEITDDAACIVFDLPEPVTPGWHRMCLEIESDASVRPRVAFDFGAGFDDTFSTRLSAAAAEGSYRGIFKLPYEVRRVRLEPGGRAGDVLTIHHLQLEPVGRSGVALLLAGRAWQLMRRDPAGFLARVPFYLKALRSPFFHQVHDDSPAGKAGYAGWIERHDFDMERDGPALHEAVEALADKPLISLVVRPRVGGVKGLRATVDSVAGQIYANWELCIAVDGSLAHGSEDALPGGMAADPRIKVSRLVESGEAADVASRVLSLATGEWVAILDEGDVLAPHALAEVALEIARHPDAEIVYSDEDRIDARGRRDHPYFKPDFSRELFRSQDYLGRLALHRAQNVRSVGGPRSGFDGAQDYDLNLRIFEGIDMANIRHIPKVLCHRPVETKPTGADLEGQWAAGRRALEEHVKRTGLPANVESVPRGPYYRLRFRVGEPEPLVSLIIPTRDKVDLLRTCIRSILEKTTYRNYEILVVDNGSSEPETIAYLDELRQIPNVRVIPYDRPFNYSAINNHAVSRANGTIIGLVNNDIEVISPDWLTEMVSWAVQADIGCVGAKLYYPDGTIQHAGVVLGVGGVANHILLGARHDDPGYFGRALVVGNVSAVTAACLLVRKEVFLEVGGLEEEHLTVAFNDVDLCLKTREAGYLNVWTPFAELYHAESVSRGSEDDAGKFLRHFSEIQYLRATWASRLEEDPYYSPNFSKRRADWSIAE